MISKYINLKHLNNLKNVLEKEDIEKIKEASKAIKEGKLVLFPTETVYGIGANAISKEAVEKIFIAKGRADDNPLIVHISNIEMLNMIVKSVSKIEQKLIDIFWPGPLTIIFNKKDIISDIVTARLNTVAVRMPNNLIAKALIKYSKLPIAAPSANISGRPSGTLIEDIIDELDGKVEYIIDSGITEIGVESTVVRVIDDKVHILRPGKISKEQIEKLGIKVIIEKQVLNEYKTPTKVMSPGIKYKHYSPNTKCLLIYSNDNEKLVNKVKEKIAEYKNNVLVLTKTKNFDKYDIKYKLDMGETQEQISKNIFTYLRKVDLYEVDLVIIEGVEKENLGLAIMNRLIRACEHNYIEC